jgi:hypothetical protein
MRLFRQGTSRTQVTDTNRSKQNHRQHWVKKGYPAGDRTSGTIITLGLERRILRQRFSKKSPIAGLIGKGPTTNHQSHCFHPGHRSVRDLVHTLVVDMDSLDFEAVRHIRTVAKDWVPNKMQMEKSNATCKTGTP